MYHFFTKIIMICFSSGSQMKPWGCKPELSFFPPTFKIDKIALDAIVSNLGFVFKSEHKEAVESLLKGRDVFGVLSKVLGKSLIFQLFVLVKKKEPFNSPK